MKPGKKKVSIIGAGFAGMTLALRLAQKGFEVDLYENSSRVGGLLGTDKTEYGIAERAANALICSEHSMALFSELHLEPSVPLKSAKKRFIFRDKPRSWPLNFKETLSFIFKLLPQLMKGRKSFLPQQKDTLQQWGLKHLGEAPTKFILGPAMQGVYGNEISGLSASLILSPLFLKRKKQKYKGLLTGPGGMQDLVDKLTDKLDSVGVKVHLNAAVKVKDLVTPVVVATSAKSASELLTETHPDIVEALNKIKMSSLMSVTLFFEKAQKNYRGFGCLIPRGCGLKTLGILMNSYIFKDRDKTYNETWILGGVADSALLELSNEELLDFILKERFRILGIKEAPLEYKINRWKNALPYYDLQLEDAQRTLLKQSPKKDIYLHGNYLSGIGLSKILERSEYLADKIAADYN